MWQEVRSQDKFVQTRIFLSVNIYNILCSLVFPPIGLKVSSFSCRASGSTFVWAHCSSCRHCLGLMVGQKTRDGQGESWRLQGSEIDLLQHWSLSLNLAGCLQPCSKCGCWPQRATGQHGMFQSSNLTVFVCWVITGRVSSAILDFLNTAESTRRWSWDEMPRHVWEHTSRRIQKRRVIKSVEDSATIVPNYFFAAEISLVVSCDRSQIMESFCFLYFFVVGKEFWDQFDLMTNMTNIVPVLEGFKPRVDPQVPAAHHQELRAGRSQKHQPDPFWRVLSSAEIRLGAKWLKLFRDIKREYYIGDILIREKGCAITIRKLSCSCLQSQICIRTLHCRIVAMILCVHQTFLISDAQGADSASRSHRRLERINRFDKGICKFSIERCPKQWHSGGLLGRLVTKSFQILKGSGSSMILNEHPRWSTREISSLCFFPDFVL